MFQDLFYQTHCSESFASSQCMQHEHALANFFSSMLDNLGYSTVDPVRRIWKRDNKTVVVCLADDFNICGADFSKTPAEWFDKNTIVITDNFITCDTQYRVLQLPTSYFGIFAYTPALKDYNPVKRFHFSVNRLDTQRQMILFELIKQSGSLDNVLGQDYVNFNSRDSFGANNTLQDIQNNFIRYWAQVDQYHSEYQQYKNSVVGALPIRNHTLTIEQASSNAYLNLVVETYAGNTTVTFSEKTFRSLVTPSPWTLFAAKGAVEYLEELGFDVMRDLLDHNYDIVPHDDWPGNARIAKYISESTEQYTRLSNMDTAQIASRASTAAAHNQALLHNMRKRWPVDFANWLLKVIAQLE